MYRIILASGSPRRKEILGQIGVKFEVITSSKEENMENGNPEELVQELAKIKAFDVAERIDDKAVIIGADTVVVHNGQVLGKPKDTDDAVQMIMNLQGDMHYVYTGVSIIIKEADDIRQCKTFVSKTKVVVTPVTKKQASAYVSTGESLDKAGAYAIQGGFAPYVERIEGDYYNVVGLPVSAVYHELLKMGIDLFQIN